MLRNLAPPKETNPEIEARVRAMTLSDSVTRARYFAFFLALLFGGYGFSSYEFLKGFYPQLTLWDNVWPRLLENTLPLLLVSWLLRSPRLSEGSKLLIWVTVYSIVTHLAAWVYVWPLVLSGHPELLLYVNSANVFIFALLYVVIAPPIAFLIPFTLMICVFFIGPLFWVASHAGDPVIYHLIINDSLFTIVSGAILSVMIQQLYSRLLRMDLTRASEARKYLGPVVGRAIYDDDSDLLIQRQGRGFVVTLDVRGSTELLNRHQQAWLDFQHDYNREISRIIFRHHGYLQKTIGDSHVFNFGVVPGERGLEDIPGIETELKFAEQRRLQQASDDAFACLDEIFRAVPAIARSHFPGEAIRIGAGIDKSEVTAGVHGDESQALQYDVNGTAVNCSNRLEKLSKLIGSQADHPASILVISPFASDYLPQGWLILCRRINLGGDHDGALAVPDFPRIRWVLVREYVSVADARESGLRKAA